jgi:hypothetical protein
LLHVKGKGEVAIFFGSSNYDKICHRTQKLETENCEVRRTFLLDIYHIIGFLSSFKERLRRGKMEERRDVVLGILGSKLAELEDQAAEVEHS